HRRDLLQRLHVPLPFLPPAGVQGFRLFGQQAAQKGGGPLQVAQAAVLVLCHPFSPFRRVPAACPQDTTARTAATARPFSVCFLHQKPPFSLPKAQKKEAASSGPHTVKKVPSSRHVRMDGTHTGKLSAESVRAALRRVRGSALNFVPRDCEAEARPADETAEAEQGQRSAFCKPA